MSKKIKDEIIDTLTGEFEFLFSAKGKGIWLQETSDQVFLLISYQASRSKVFYLNFGAYFRAMAPIAKTPKISEWHLLARYERFAKIAVPEFNCLFSIEDEDLGSLEERCTKIATYSKENIIPKLQSFGDYDLMRENLSADGSQVFEPYWAQNVSKADIVSHILGH